MGHYDRCRERYDDLNRFYEEHSDALDKLVGKQITNKKGDRLLVSEIDWDRHWFLVCKNIEEDEIEIFDIDGRSGFKPSDYDIDIESFINDITL